MISKPWLTSSTSRGARSAMLIFSKAPKDPTGSRAIPLFRQNLGGLVLRHSELRLLCSYPEDGRTQGSPCRWGKWCDPEHSGCWSEDCAYSSSDLKSMLQVYQRCPQQPNGPHNHNPMNNAGYNEVVLDEKSWSENLPRTVAAFFFTTSPSCQSRCREDARQVHRSFLDEYRLTSMQVPLLLLDVKNWQAPFSAVDPGQEDGVSSARPVAGPPQRDAGPQLTPSKACPNGECSQCETWCDKRWHCAGNVKACLGCSFCMYE
eukprot:CAMPEP_0119299558 /NCGR_PEP_ID=MMETSP1333-20130426/1632_1 /TAXON_ID=418940 /ORGANISM="Scyphosphaera apsteinii, Strain RCC1455" /LENGTH=260 /DNA_ID=CAMNT_0007301025 /DNA_START=268 /DNA_END=1050 /DNA_ORIENTATION=+